MNNTNNQHVLNGFLNAVLTATKQIRYNAQYMDHERRVERHEIDFSNIITHPTHRVLLQPNEFAVTRATHPNPRFAHTSNVILIRGTEYGVIVMFGQEAAYSVNDKTKMVNGPMPHLHVGRAFMAAAARFFKRRNIHFSLLACEAQLLDWIFSPTFEADLAEQAKIDLEAEAKASLELYQENGTVNDRPLGLLGDGLPPKPFHKKKPDGENGRGRVGPSNDSKFERRHKPRHNGGNQKAA